MSVGSVFFLIVWLILTLVLVLSAKYNKLDKTNMLFHFRLIVKHIIARKVKKLLENDLETDHLIVGGGGSLRARKSV